MASIFYLILFLGFFASCWITVGWFHSRSELARILRDTRAEVEFLRGGHVIHCGPDCTGHHVSPHRETP